MKALTALCLLGWAGACTGQIGDGALDPPPPDDIHIDEGPAATGPRRARRLSAEQLRASLMRATGFDYLGSARVRDATTPQGSIVRDNVPLLEVYRGSLGAPDYNYVTQPALEPSMTFAKLAGDGVRAVCRLVSDAELGDEGHPSGEAHLLLVPGAESQNEEAIRANLVLLSLRYWGQIHAENDATIDALFALHQTAGADAAAPWRAVCIGMLSDARFLTY